MTETTEISTFSPTDLIPAEDKYFDDLSSGKSFLPTLKLFAAQSKAVAANKIAMAHWGVQTSKTEIIDLGKNPDVIFYSHRYKAVEKVGGEYINYYDEKSENFKRTKAKAEADKQSGCMAGIEFLCWLPSLGKFAIYYANNTSALKISKEIRALYTKFSTLSSEFVEWKDFSWYAPKINLCSTDLTLPEMSQLESVGRWFLTPKESSKEVDEDADTRDR